MKNKLFHQLIVFLFLLCSMNLLWASDSRGNLTDTNRCVTVNSQDIKKICYDLQFKWRFEPIAFKTKFRLEPIFNVTKIHWKNHIDANSSMVNKKKESILLGQSIFSAKVSGNKWFIFTTQKIKQNNHTVQSQDLKWGKIVAKNCGDNNKESECSCFTNEANRPEKLSPFYINSATSKDLLRGGFELNNLKPCRLNFQGIKKEKNSITTVEKISDSTVSSNKKINQINEEVFYWNLIKRSPSLSKYQEYMKDYPNGQFVSLAKIEISRYDTASNNSNKTISQTVENDPMAHCQSLLRSNQLTTGQSGNANQCFKSILKKDPNNIKAKSGLLSIENRYATWAKNALNSGNEKKAESYIKKIELVNPDSIKVVELRQELKQLRLDNELQSTQVLDNKLLKLQRAINDNDVNQSEEILTELQSSNVAPSKYNGFNKKFLIIKDKHNYDAIKTKVNNNQLKEAELMLEEFKKTALDYSQYIELKNLYLAALEDADKAHLNLTTNISDSLVELNGIEKGFAPVKLSLNKGETYQLKITKEGYVTQIITMTMYKDRDLNLKMEKNARYIVRNGEKILITESSNASTANKVAPVSKKENLNIPSIKDSVAGIEMINIKPGCFIMGSPKGEQRRDFDETQHKICFKQGFKIGKYEITQQQWKTIMGRNPAYFDECGANCPVEDIDWYTVQKFIKKLNKQSDLNYRLPTEAEWEYVARAGTTTPYNTGSCLLPQQANYKTGKTNCIKTNGKLIKPAIDPSSLPEVSNLDKKMTQPVGSYPPNAWGVYDVHGNVREWTCSEFFSRYNGSEQRCHIGDISVTGEVDNSFKISTRGGSWNYQYQWSRSAERDKDLPTANNKGIGFRLMRQ